MVMKKEYDFSKLRRAQPKYLKHLKESVTMRLDRGVLRYFKSMSQKTSLPYQSLISYVLKDYVNCGLEPTANWKSVRVRSKKRA
jgi:predicted DNA binding CopG/RHH family protein